MEEGSERTERLGNDAWMELERKWDSMPGEEVAGRCSSVFRSHPCSALDDGCLEAPPPPASPRGQGRASDNARDEPAPPWTVRREDSDLICWLRLLLGPTVPKSGIVMWALCEFLLVRATV